MAEKSIEIAAWNSPFALVCVHFDGILDHYSVVFVEKPLGKVESKLIVHNVLISIQLVRRRVLRFLAISYCDTKAFSEVGEKQFAVSLTMFLRRETGRLEQL